MISQNVVSYRETPAHTCRAQKLPIPAVPATLQATIASRIDRLDPIAKRTLNAAAVVGSQFGIDVLSRLDVEPEVVDLVAAQFIDQVTFGAHPEYVFHHPLIRAVAYEAQLKADRADLHRRVAAAIEQQNPASLDEKSALIGEHVEAAGDLHAAFDWHMRAGTWSNNRDVAAARVSWDRARQVADALPRRRPGAHGDAHRAAHHPVRHRLAGPCRRLPCPLQRAARAVRAGR